MSAAVVIGLRANRRGKQMKRPRYILIQVSYFILFQFGKFRQLIGKVGVRMELCFLVPLATLTAYIIINGPAILKLFKYMFICAF